MKLAAYAGLGLFAAVVVTAQLASVERDGDLANQIRLDRPVGETVVSQPAGPSPSGTIVTITADETLRILRGLKADSITIEQGKTSRYVKIVIDNHPTFIWLNNCKEQHCAAMHFAAYLGKQEGVSEAFIHDYNRNTMFTKLARDKSGELQLTMGISLIRGVTEEHVRAMAESWLIYFRDALSYKPEGR